MSARGLFLSFIIGIFALGAGGCSARPPPFTRGPTVVDDHAIAAHVLVFSDGFHSGFIVPTAECPLLLDPERPSPAVVPYTEIGFGEVRWATGEDRSFWHAMRLATWPAHGIFVLENLEGPKRSAYYDGRPCRYWWLHLTARGQAAFYRGLESWFDRTHEPPPRYEDDAVFFLLSTRDYDLFNTCHDFTAQVLKASGFPMGAGAPARTAAMLERQVDKGFAILRRFEVHAVEPAAPVSK